MRTRSIAALGLAAVFAIGCSDSLTTEPASVADGGSVLASSHGNNGAVRWIPDPFCAVFDGDENPVFVDCRNQIATFSKNGNAIVVVQKNGVPNSTGRTLKWDAMNPPQVLLDFYELDGPPAPCFVLDTNGDALFTIKWKGSLTPGGSATFICHYQKKWEFQWPE